MNGSVELPRLPGQIAGYWAQQPALLHQCLITILILILLHGMAVQSQALHSNTVIIGYVGLQDLTPI